MGNWPCIAAEWAISWQRGRFALNGWLLGNMSSESILVEGQLRGSDAIGLLVSVAVAFVSIPAILQGNRPAVAVLGASTIVAAVAATRLVLTLRRRTRLTTTETGFILENSKGRREFQDGDVVRLAWLERDNYRGADPISTHRCMTLTLSGWPRPLAVRHTVRTDDSSDPWAAFYERVMSSYTSRMAEHLKNNGIVAGPNWSLSNSTLTVGREPNTETFGIDELQDPLVIDEHVTVWRWGERRPVLRVPTESPDALLIETILPTLIEENGAKERVPDEDDPLGRLLFERRVSRVYQVATWLGMGVCMFLGVGLLVARQPDTGVFSAVMLGGAALFLVSGLANRKRLFRCHERGVVQESWTGERKLEYSQMHRLTYIEREHVYRSKFTAFIAVAGGISVKMVFEPEPQSPLPTIRIHHSTWTPETSLGLLRDTAALNIAQRMATKIIEGETVPWTKVISFSPEGIHCLPAIVRVGRKGQLVPYHEIERVDLHDGVFYVWQTGRKSAVTWHDITINNFFPGYYLLLNILGHAMPFADPDLQELTTAIYD